MKRRTHTNPPLFVSALVSLMPYAIIGGVLYFYGKDIWAALGSKLTGISSEKLKADVATVKGATTGEVLKGVTGILTFGLYDPSKVDYTTHNKNIIDLLTKAIKNKWVTQAELPYPTATSTSELNANQAYVNAKTVKNRGKGYITR